MWKFSGYGADLKKVGWGMLVLDGDGNPLAE
jgi:hypothetical protein